jgi:ABC-2 type transport system ATP-binding protein
MAPAIAVTGLAKRYGDTEAVRGVSFDVARGEIVGLLGPNGAGKSTTLNMLATLVAPTAGEARIFGHSLEDLVAVRSLLGVALQVTGVDPMMSVRRHFEVQAALYRISSRQARARTSHLIEAFGLEPVCDRRAGELSGGTQRRLSLALALLHEPRAIVFDEPTVGLDPNARRVVWALLEEMRERGLAILFSTHDMEEADRLCDRIEVISGGLIFASGTPAELKAKMGAGMLQVRVRGQAELAAGAMAAAASDGFLPSNLRFGADADLLQVHTDIFDPSFLPLLTLLLEEVGVDIVEINWGYGTLHDVFGSLEEPAEGDLLSAVTVEHRVHARRG